MEPQQGNNEKVQPFRECNSTPTYAPVTVTNVPGTQPPPYSNYTVKRSHCENIQKSNAQSNSTLGGNLLLFISGLHIAWGIWRIALREPWTRNLNISLQIFTIMCWYVFATIGGIIGAILVSNLRKKWIYYIGSIIMAISSLLFIIWYDSHVAIIIGRCFAGVAHGLVYNATITHAAENVIKELRGMALSAVNSISMMGMFTGTITISTAGIYSDGLTGDRIIGIIGLIFSVLSILCTSFLTYETIPFLLRRGMEEEAVTNMLKLRKESVMTTEISNDLNEMRLMVIQDKQENHNIFSHGNGLVTAKMIALRIMSNLSNNLLLNTILMSSSIYMFHPTSYHLTPVVLVVARFVGSLIPFYVSDLVRRRIFLTVSGLVCGNVLLILGICLFIGVYLDTASKLFPTLSIIFQFFASIGIDPMSHIHLSEAFSTSKKAWSIAYVTAAEYLSQILLIGIAFTDLTTNTSIFAVTLIHAFLLNGLAIFLLWALPETLKTSMIQARDLFRKGFAQNYVVDQGVQLQN